MELHKESNLLCFHNNFYCKDYGDDMKRQKDAK
jgi:hypothetical protein